MYFFTPFSLTPSLPSNTVSVRLVTILDKNSQKPSILPQIDKLTFYK